MSRSGARSRQQLNKSRVGFADSDSSTTTPSSTSGRRRELNQSGTDWGSSDFGSGGDWGSDSATASTSTDASSTFGGDADWGTSDTSSTATTTKDKQQSDGWGDWGSESSTSSTGGGGDWGSGSSTGGDWDSGTGGSDGWGGSGSDMWGSSGGQSESNSRTPRVILQSAKMASAKRLRYVFYNVGNPEDIQRWNRSRPAGFDEYLWNQAMKDNPDPTRLGPVQACGFADLEKRLGVQNEETSRQRETVERLAAKVASLKKHHELVTLVELQKYKRQVLVQGNRVLELLAKIEILQAKGLPISAEEEVFRTKLESLQRELNRPSKLRNQLRELEALVAMQDDVQPDAYPVLDEQSIEQITSHLKEQQQGIAKLRELLKEDLAELNVMLSYLK